jgi:hypothetical protein
MAGVAWKNSQRLSTNIKAGHEFKQKHLEAEFRQSKFSEPRLWWRKTDIEFFLPNFKKNAQFQVHIKKLQPFYQPPLS